MSTDLTVDSATLWAQATSIKEPEERNNSADLAAIREVFNHGKLNFIHWWAGIKMLADPPTIDSPSATPLLFKALPTEKQYQPLWIKTKYGLTQTDRYRSASACQIVAKEGRRDIFIAFWRPFWLIWEVCMLPAAYSVRTEYVPLFKVHVSLRWVYCTLTRYLNLRVSYLRIYCW